MSIIIGYCTEASKMLQHTYRIAGNWVQIFVKSCRGSSELIFVVLNFVTPDRASEGSMPAYSMGRR